MKESTVSKEYIGQRVKEIIQETLAMNPDMSLMDPKEMKTMLE